MDKILKVGCVIFLVVGVIFITAMFVGVDVQIDEDSRSRISFGDHPGFRLTRQLKISDIEKDRINKSFLEIWNKKEKS
jgi:hypothetical protein